MAIQLNSAKYAEILRTVRTVISMSASSIVDLIDFRLLITVLSTVRWTPFMTYLSLFFPQPMYMFVYEMKYILLVDL